MLPARPRVDHNPLRRAEVEVGSVGILLNEILEGLDLAISHLPAKENAPALDGRLNASRVDPVDRVEQDPILLEYLANPQDFLQLRLIESDPLQSGSSET